MMYIISIPIGLIMIVVLAALVDAAPGIGRLIDETAYNPFDDSRDLWR